MKSNEKHIRVSENMDAREAVTPKGEAKKKYVAPFIETIETGRTRVKGGYPTDASAGYGLLGS